MRVHVEGRHQSSLEEDKEDIQGQSATPGYSTLAPPHFDDMHASTSERYCVRYYSVFCFQMMRRGIGEWNNYAIWRQYQTSSEAKPQQLVMSKAG